jgi:hypothetical protein
MMIFMIGMMSMIIQMDAYLITTLQRWNMQPPSTFTRDASIPHQQPKERHYGWRQRHSIFGHSSVFNTQHSSSSIQLLLLFSATTATTPSLLPDTEEATSNTEPNITNTSSSSSTSELKNSYNSNNIMTIRDELLDLVSSMRGEEYEIRRLEDCINTLESTYIPCQTVSFLNLMMNGSWQFLFSSHLINRTSVMKSFRLREMKQQLHTSDVILTAGNVTNTCIWEWNQQPSDSMTFDCYGTFSIQSDYVINTNGRILQCPSSVSTGSVSTGTTTTGNNNNQEEEQETQEDEPQPEMILELLPKSSVPNNVTQLIQYIQRTMSQELFDIMNTGYDITYMDDTIRIIRYFTPTKYDGIRNIFRRC